MANLKKRTSLESRVCECGCGKYFDVKPCNPKRFFDRGHASRMNARLSVGKYAKSCRKLKAGVKEKTMPGLGKMNDQIRAYEDEQIKKGKLPPRQSYRDFMKNKIRSEIKTTACEKEVVKAKRKLSR